MTMSKTAATRLVRRSVGPVTRIWMRPDGYGYTSETRSHWYAVENTATYRQACVYRAAMIEAGKVQL